ncbi:trypsin-like peptidase domain-containing protein [Streptomyces sp. NPDC058420]|uniref:S1C family serine protease n=1 Tax=Streptomyces sp. NPDC058420 TaxID=3346489 RepID=UPI0036500A5C
MPRADASAPDASALLGTPPAVTAPPPSDTSTSGSLTSADLPGTPVVPDPAPAPVPEYLAPVPVSGPAPATPRDSAASVTPNPAPAPTSIPEHLAPALVADPAPATPTDSALTATPNPVPAPIQSPDPAPALVPEYLAPVPVSGPAPATPTDPALTVIPNPVPAPIRSPDPAPTPVPAHPAPTPAPGSAPAPIPDPVPTPEHPAPASTPKPDPAPTQNPDSTLAPTPTSPSLPTSDPHPHPAPATTPTPPNPWHRYDPWAPQTPAPLQQTGASPSTRTPTRPRTLLTSALALALLAGGVGGVIGAYIEQGGPGGDIVLPQAGKDDTGRAADTVAGIAARALPSVVTLRVTGGEESGTGTGIVLDGRGDILTNNHVVRPGGGGGAISVRFSGGQTVKGEVVGRDVGYDLAVVRVRGVRGLRAMPLGNSDNVRVGDPVVAIGAPFGLDNTVTAGIVSAKERPVTTGGNASDGSDVSYLDALQTDASINPGNSGGPLLDARGLLVGVNSAIRSADEQDGEGEGEEGSQSGSVGLGFAIPVNQAKRVAEELINHGKATHPVIGVTLDLDYAGDGARVATPKAGLKAGDVITQVDGQPVHSGDELVVRTRAHRPGDHLRLTLRRGGEDMTLSLVLGSATGD